jgi:formamidopyrimidine-DNA glycosylase
MPELPEVETVVRGLRTALPGRSIVSVRLGKTDFIDDPVALGESLPGRRITAVERIGKFIHLQLAPETPNGSTHSDAPSHLMVHLGMTGRLVVRAASEPAPPHTHVYFELDDGRELRYTDIRRFGQMLLLHDAKIAELRERLGEDALTISAEEFRQRLAGRRARIKALLLDQSVLRGVGNIYADESLWRARLHPERLAAKLTGQEIDRLRQTVQRVLGDAIRLRGSSISDFVDSDGQPGGYQKWHRVYAREDKPCYRCHAIIRRVIVAGRSSHFCPRCQPQPRTPAKLRAKRPPRVKQPPRSQRASSPKRLRRAK